MSTEISKIINSDEILVRFIFTDNIKKDRIHPNTFMPYKGGVSLQRYSFCDENKCKEYAMKIPKEYTGFLLFKKKTFELLKTEYINTSRKDFQAEIVPTPLKIVDGEYEIIDITNDSICLDTIYNPSHADLKYINPAPQGEESPKTAIRSFSRKLILKCQRIIDANPKLATYNQTSFNQVI